MSRHIIAANDLRSGRIVYLGEGGRWVSALGGAAVAEGEDALGALRAEGDRALRENNVTALRAVALEGDAPLTLMERIGSQGPSVRPDLAGEG